MIIKVSQSGKQVQIVDDDGNVFGTSVLFVRRMLDELDAGKFLLLTRLPHQVSPDRFVKSPLWDPNKGAKKPADTVRDAYSESHKKTLLEKESYMNDEVVF